MNSQTSNKQSDQLKSEIETMTGLMSTVIDENKSYIHETKSLKDEIIILNKKNKEHLLKLASEHEENIKNLTDQIDELKTIIQKMRNDNRSELMIQAKIIERLKKYINVLKKELIISKNILKNSETVVGTKIKDKIERNMNFDVYPFRTKIDEFLDPSPVKIARHSRSTTRNQNMTIDYQRVRLKMNPNSHTSSRFKSRVMSTSVYNPHHPMTPPNQNEIRFIFSPVEIKRAKHQIFSR